MSRVAPDAGLSAGLAGAGAVVAAVLALVPVFADLGWLPAALAAVGVVTATGLLARWLHLDWAAPLLGAAGLLVLGAAAVAPETALAGLVPTPSTLPALVAEAQRGLADVRDLAVPVPSTPGLTLLAAGGAGLVALAVDLLVATARRPALAGVPLLGLVVVALAVLPQGLPIWSFLLLGAAFLTLLLVDDADRLSRWGALVPSRRGAGRSSRAAVGRRIGLASLALGAGLPLLLPATSAGAFGVANEWGLGLGAASRSIVTYNPIVQLKDQLTQPVPTDLLRVETSAERPPYLRMTVLDVYDGSTWGQSELRAGRDQRVSGDLPAPDGLDGDVPAERVATDVQALALDVPWLPTPARVVDVAVEGDWRYDDPTRTIFSTHQTTASLGWSTTTLEIAPDPALLRSVVDPAAGLAPDRYASLTALPPSPEVAQLARTVVAEAGASTPFDAAVALQQLLRGPQFSYSETADSGSGGDRIAGFLLEGRRGYCEQFAASFAVMARSLGLASRVAIGFLPGDRGADGAWTVATDDAHAWPEVWFDGVGWLAFEPTPGASGSVAPSYAPATPSGTAAAEDAADAAPAPGPSAAASAPSGGADGGPLARALEGSAPQQGGGATGQDGATGDGGLSLPVLPLVAAVALLALPGVARVAVRRRRLGGGGPSVPQAWGEVLDTADDLRLPVPAAATPRSTAATLAAAAALDGAAAAALRDLAGGAERAAYARDAGAAPDAATVRTVRRALLGAVSRRDRWRARLLPASVLRSGSAALGRVADRLADVTAAGAQRVRARLPRRA